MPAYNENSYAPPKLDYRLWADEDLARWSEVDPDARMELQRRMSGPQDPLMNRRPMSAELRALQQSPGSPNPAAMGPTGIDRLMAQVQALQPPGSIDEVRSRNAAAGGPVNTQAVPQGMAPAPEWGQAIGEYLQAYPGRAKNTLNAGIDWAMAKQGMAGAPAGAAPGSFRGAQEAGEAPGPDMIEKGMAIAQRLFGKTPGANSGGGGGGWGAPGGPAPGGQMAGAPVPGPKPPVPPQVAAAVAQRSPTGPAPVGPTIDMTGGTPPAPPQAPQAAEPSGGLSKSQQDALMRFGLNLMAESGPQPGQTRTTTLGSAIGRAGVKTMDSIDKAQARADAIKLKQSEGEANRAVQRERNTILRENNLARNALAERKAIMDAEWKVQEQALRAQGQKNANIRKIADIRKTYDEMINNAIGDPETQARLKSERDNELRALGAEPVEVTSFTDKATGEKAFYRKNAQGQWVRVK